MENKLLKELRLLKLYSLTLTVVLLLFIIYSFTGKNSKPHFEEIDVERINIVEKDGKLKMVISNQQRQHPGMINGKEIPKRSRPAGIIFFNSAGDECGGLVYDGDAKEASMVYSIDQFRNDQVMQLNYEEDHSGPQHKRAYGLKLWDRPESLTLARQMQLSDSLKAGGDSAWERFAKQQKDKGEWPAERFFAGKNVNGEVGLFLRDSKGKPRIKLYVDAQNNPRLEFLDESGNTVPVK
jgi:hypothetical protein